MTVSADATLSLAGHVLNVSNGSIANAGTIGDGVIRMPVASVRAVDANGSDISTIKTSSGTIIVRVDAVDQTPRAIEYEAPIGGPLNGPYAQRTFVSVHDGAIIV